MLCPSKDEQPFSRAAPAVPTAPEKLGTLDLMKQKHFGSATFYKDLEVMLSWPGFEAELSAVF